MLGGGEDPRERLCRPTACLAVVGDEDLVEERLVEQAADAVGCLLVDGVTVRGEVQAPGELRTVLGVVRAGGVEPVGDLCQGGADAILFRLELVEGDRAGVVGLEELVPLGEQVVLLLGPVSGFVFGGGVEDRELFRNDRFEDSYGVGVELFGGVVTGDGVFDVVDVHRFASAVGGLAVTAEADEVRVDRAVAVLRMRDRQP